MAERELGGNIVLSNFSLDNDELIIAKKMIGNYAKKIRNFADYDQLKLEMKKHSKNKNDTFEINSNVIIKGDVFTSKSQGFNPFILINETLEKVLEEIKHKTQKE